MVVIPKKNAIFQNLNSYYINIPKLIEHFQGELGAGSLHFKSTIYEGVIFFDAENILNGFYLGQNGQMVEMRMDRLLEETALSNFLLSVYPMNPENIYFWSQIPKAKRIYKDLSSEFTALRGLANKMSAEKLTGYIDATIGDKLSGALIFFKNGENLGGAYSWSNGELDSKKENFERLINEAENHGAVFHVFKIDLQKLFSKKELPSDKEDGAIKTDNGELPGIADVLIILEGLLNIFERVVITNKRIKENFSVLLKKKFVQKIGSYDFLDPFAAEFEYVNRKVVFNGSAGSRELAQGVAESVAELAEELGVLRDLKKETAPWSEKHSRDLSLLKLEI